MAGMALMAISLVSGIMQADAQQKQGQQDQQLADLNAANVKTEADFVASQLKASATRERAEGIISGNEAKLAADYEISRITALAGASGGGVFDKNIVDAIVGFEVQGDLNRRLEIYKGEVAGSELELQAEAATFSGISQADALTYSGASAAASGERQSTATLIGTGSSMFSTYQAGSSSGLFN